uniref:hypothetical protein n=1 Tax=Trichocoleus desertorum TaxID=1481672 RepID=UPI0025B52215|nr:hypothetical protein [Trichocoleus desertorum]
MSRIPTVAELTRRLNALKTREANLKARQAANTGQRVGMGQKRPTESAAYGSPFTLNTYTVNAGKAAVTFFGGLAALGLTAPAGDDPLPRGFKVGQVKATRGKATATKVTAELSQRSYLRYSIEAGTDTQGTFTAPLTGGTLALIKTKFTAIAAAKKDDIGEYGRIDYVPEQPVFSIGGDAGAAAP